MATDLLRSNVEASKRLFLDRLTTDQQKLLQTNIDEGPGDVYVYGNVGDSNNFGIGFDCSGLDGVVIGTALFGFAYWAGKGYYRLFTTETFPGPFAGFRQVSQQDCINSASPIKVMIGHYGGGENSHMACIIDGWHMESNGDYGVIGGTNLHRPGITAIDDNYWNDWWVYDGTITEDTTWRQPMGYPQGLDYAGGYIPGADLVSAGITFVCRYINDGGTGLPKKLLQAAEFIDLCKAGIRVIFNYETTADFMLNDNGANDAVNGLAYVRGLLNAAKDQGITTVYTVDTSGNPINVNIDDYKPVIYFSADFDEAPEQDGAIAAFLDSAKSVLGINSAGKSCAAAYGAYWLLSRAHASGHVDYMWQTEAWSGGNIDSAIAVMQRNGVGYTTIDGVQCDVDEAHMDDIGAFMASTASNPIPIPPPPAPPASNDIPDATTLLRLVAEQLMGPWDPVKGAFTGWTQDGQDSNGNNLFLNDLLVKVDKTLDEIQSTVTATQKTVNKPAVKTTSKG